jgi:hypothetical protein
MPRASKPSPARATTRKKARSLIDRPLITGSLVTSARMCGNKGCRCTRGHKHVSTYLAVNVEGKRKMICVPKHLEADVKRCVDNHRNLQKALAGISRDCLEAFINDKKGKRLF